MYGKDLRTVLALYRVTSIEALTIIAIIIKCGRTAQGRKPGQSVGLDVGTLGLEVQVFNVWS